ESGAAEAPPADPVEEIARWHQNRDEMGKSSVVSPFTAVNSWYVDAGATAHLGADASGIRKDPASPMEAMADVTYRDDAFTVAPVAGAKPPTVHPYDDEGEPEAEGADVTAPHKVTEDEAVGLGRDFLEMSPQSGFGRIIAYDPEAPARKAFTGFKWFPPDPGLAVKATWKPDPAPSEMKVATSRGLEKTFYRAGRFEFEIDGKPEALTGLSDTQKPEPGDGLFVPFQDATTGKETYEVGRYLPARIPKEGDEATLDFNKATNPLCNYSPHYNCPIPPKENRLDVAIRAGEMAYPKP
ncbi:MAG TPA: DUF1684 domain-containing protein, partial [Candidatus Saccharimonadales bacterium]|nr:DUF1684 domain-containing protein [Candidatus Saccharimonadales bacterium]